MDLEKLEKLNELKEKGILSQEEFEAKKKELLTAAPVQTAPQTSDMIPMGVAYTSYWQNSFVWKGRATRAEYWWPVLVNMLINIVLSIISPIAFIFAGVYVLFQIATIFPGLAVYVRRMHDVNKSAWFAFSPVFVGLGLAVLAAFGAVAAYTGTDIGALNTLKTIIFVLGGFGLIGLSIAMFVFCCLPGTKGNNKYGPESKGVK